jgi:putative endonuclease
MVVVRQAKRKPGPITTAFSIECGMADSQSGSMYHVYMLASGRHGTLYTGVTNSIRGRLEQHRAGRGSGFVAKYKRTGWFIWKAMKAPERRFSARSS